MNKILASWLSIGVCLCVVALSFAFCYFDWANGIWVWVLSSPNLMVIYTTSSSSLYLVCPLSGLRLISVSPISLLLYNISYFSICLGQKQVQLNKFKIFYIFYYFNKKNLKKSTMIYLLIIILSTMCLKSKERGLILLGINWIINKKISFI